MISIKDRICRVFGHKWTYFRIDEQHVRCCRRCNRLQHRIYFIGKKVWTFSVQYTELDAMHHVEGYNET